MTKRRRKIPNMMAIAQSNCCCCCDAVNNIEILVVSAKAEESVSVFALVAVTMGVGMVVDR